MSGPGASRPRRPMAAQSRPPSTTGGPPVGRSGNGSQGTTVPPLSERLRRVPPASASSASPAQPRDVELEPELDVETMATPSRVRASIFGERPAPGRERAGSSGPVSLNLPEDLDDEDDRDDKRSRPGDSDADTDAFVIRPRISAKQASELTFNEERPSWRSRLRKSGPDLGPSNLSAVKS